MSSTTALCRAGLIAAAALIFWVDGARADGWYMAVDIGGAVTDDPSGSDGFTTELTPGIAGGMAVGYRFGAFRVDGEYRGQTFFVDDQTAGGVPRSSTDSVDGNLTTQALMANGYLDFDIGGGWRPYAGIGAGLAFVEADYRFANVCVFICGVDVVLVEDEDIVPAFQARIGIAIEVAEKSEFYVGYRYFATGDASFTDESGTAIDQNGQSTNIAEVGIRLAF